MRSRPVPVTVAAILLALCSLLSLPGPLLPGSEGVPEVVLYSGIVLGIVGLVAAVGLWMLKKWSLWLTTVVSVLNILSAAPGVAFAPNTPLQVAATVTVVVFALNCAGGRAFVLPACSGSFPLSYRDDLSSR
jgi:hypothetical protein